MMKSYNSLEKELLAISNNKLFLGKYKRLNTHSKKRFFKKYAKKIPCVFYKLKYDILKNISVHDISLYNDIFNNFILNSPNINTYYNRIKYIYQIDFDIVKNVIGLDIKHDLIYQGHPNMNCLEYILDCSNVNGKLKVDLLKIILSRNIIKIYLCDIYGNIHKTFNINNIEEKLREAKLKYIEQHVNT